jgi:ureidoglycolate lyase
MLEDAVARPDDIVLVAQPLTAEAFAPFGEVFAVPGDGPGVAINDGTALRYDLPVTIETSAAAARLSFYRVQPARLPLRVESLERHQLGSQAFVPLSGRPWLVVVAPAGDAPEPGGVRCFLAAPDQGVNYAGHVAPPGAGARGVQRLPRDRPRTGAAARQLRRTSRAALAAVGGCTRPRKEPRCTVLNATSSATARRPPIRSGPAAPGSP